MKVINDLVRWVWRLAWERPEPAGSADRMRSVRSARYKYIRNFYPNRPYLQPNRYKDDKAVVRVVRRLHAAGALDSVQRLMLAEVRPQEEFYDLDTDRHEARNRAGDPALAGELDRHRAALADWIRETGDQGAELESEPVYMDYVFDGRPEGGRGSTSRSAARSRSRPRSSSSPGGCVKSQD